ncbi:hypothetical protein E8E13_002012 [Curvularia kusanoi]|uniref:JmjC domain-containing protein n=1 Tax=Curvularia kusanoi TaxID=90978 RepID=A0A9P4W3R2_CURKU|nr:hypothetical protein E8E13_002012 [Curvularia kusanoi]
MSTHVGDTVASSPEHACAAATLASAPTLEEIIQLTRQELTTVQEHDSIVECGRAAVALLHTNSDLCAKLAYQKLHDVPYKEVKACWRRLYTDAALWRVLSKTEGRKEDWVDEVVKLLDMTLILTAAPMREELIELWFMALEEELAHCESRDATSDAEERPAKRLKTSDSNDVQASFPTAFPDSPIALHQPIAQSDTPSLSFFQKKLSDPTTHTPLILKNAIQHWPALTSRPWNNPSYLLQRTLGGRRLVPIETGRSYTDSGWGQRITTFADFMRTHMLTNPSTTAQDAPQTGYLAQHDLFAQIPSLRADIAIPDYCFCDPAPHPLPHVKETKKLEEPLLNAWFGPKGTISPLHTDPYHNVLAQVVGYKYVRLYAPDQTQWVYPRGLEEGGVDMSNTSLVDLDEAMGLGLAGVGEAEIERGVETRAEGGQNTATTQAQTQHHPQEADQTNRQAFEARFPGFSTASYTEAILGPGDCLYLPPGWWHYVRSLSPSFSVSFWFN